jgi:hypothetical protein
MIRSIPTVMEWYMRVTESAAMFKSSTDMANDIRQNFDEGSIIISELAYGSWLDPRNKYRVARVRKIDGVRQIDRKWSVSSLSELEAEYPHVAAAYQMSKLNNNSVFNHSMFSAEEYKTGFGNIVVNRANQHAVVRTVVFPEKMFIEKGVTPAAKPEQEESDTRAIPSLDF